MHFGARISVVSIAAFLLWVSSSSGGPWKVPKCDLIRGTTAAITFTKDEGATLTPTDLELTGTSYTFGLVPLDTPNKLLAAVGSEILVSTDAGCRWTALVSLRPQTGGALLTLTKAPGDRAYAWVDNGGALFRIDKQGATTLSAPVASIVGVGVHPRHGDVVGLADSSGRLWRSKDAGATWQQVGVPPAGGLFVYRAVFDPANPNHVVVGTMVSGAFMTLNGGRTWTKSKGLAAAPGGRVNVFNGVVSPVDPQVVWVMGLDIAQADTEPSEGRHIYRSVNGGRSFAPLVDHGDGVTLVNGPTMAAHPTDPGVLYFVFGTFFGGYGTDLYKVDAATGLVTKTHNDYDDISSIAFSPSSRLVMYLGLVSEDVDNAP